MADLINYFADFGTALLIICAIVSLVSCMMWLIGTSIPQTWKDKIIAWMSDPEE